MKSIGEVAFLGVGQESGGERKQTAEPPVGVGVPPSQAYLWPPYKSEIALHARELKKTCTL